jgi:hypothetical protein
LRGRPGRKGPNPLTRSFESNGPDVKIRGTAQHVAEKYLQLARDAQSGGDVVMAENLLQHAEHYFRLIAAAQQQTPNGYGRQSFEAEPEAEDDDDFAGVPDRFAPLAERLPPPAYAAQQPAYQPQPPYQPPAQQPHFAPPPAQPQPFEERPAYGEMRHERPVRSERPQFGRRGQERNQERNQDRGAEQNGERGGEAGERGQQFGYERGRERQRFPRREQAAAGTEPPTAPELQSPAGLPAFITAPPPIAVAARSGAGAPEGSAPSAPEQGAGHEGRVGYHLSSRRRRRPRPPGEEGAGEDQGPAPRELPLGE